MADNAGKKDARGNRIMEKAVLRSRSRLLGVGSRSSSKVSDVRQVGIPDAVTQSFTSVCHDIVAPPVEREAAFRDLEREEDDEGRNGDTGWEGRGDNVIVLCPLSYWISIDTMWRGNNPTVGMTYETEITLSDELE